MKKIVATLALTGIIIFSTNSAFGQAAKLLNFGGLGTGIYASIEFPVSSAITIAPQFSTDYEFNKSVISAKGNYYLDSVFELTSAWDVYAGANLGWRLDHEGDFAWGIQMGGRWFWSDKWGINAEIGGGSGVLGGVGVSMKM